MQIKSPISSLYAQKNMTIGENAGTEKMIKILKLAMHL